MLSKFAVKHPITIIMAVLGIFVLGFISFSRLNIDMLPDISFPVIQVSTLYPNVAPEEVESNITRVIEEACSRANNLDRIDSTSLEGTSLVTIRFTWGTDIDMAALDVREKIDPILSLLPQDAKAPTIRKFDPSQLPILILGVSGGKNLQELRWLADNVITTRLESVEGVAAAISGGGLVREILISVDNEKIRALGISLNQITQFLGTENQNLPAGIAKEGRTEYLVRSIGEMQNPAKFGDIVLTTINGRPLLLKDVAEIKDTYYDPRILNRMNKEPSVSIMIIRQSAANTVQTVQKCMKELDKMKQFLPSNIKFDIAYNQATFIQDAIKSVRDNASVGAILAILIILFFLRNIRSTLIIALSIPISILATFVLIYMAKMTLNLMSLGGLALGVGLIVDDAIVVIESIYRHLHRDKDLTASEASVSGSTEIGKAVAASTFTVMIVFLPMIFVVGMAGKLFLQFALTIIFSIGVSLIMALTVVPMLTSRFLKREDAAGESFWGRLSVKAGDFFNAIDNNYRRLLRWALSHRLLVIVIVALSLVASVIITPFVGVELMPTTESGYFNVNIKLPLDVSLETTNNITKRIENMLLSNPDIKTVFATSGAISFLGGVGTREAKHRASFTVALKDIKSPGNPNGRTRTTNEIMNEIEKQLASIPASTNQVSQFDIISRILAGGSNDLEVDLFGPDLSALSKNAKDIMAKISDVRGLKALDTGWEEASPELHIIVDRDRAASLGLNYGQIANTIQTATKGTIATYYMEGGNQYDVVVQLKEAQRTTIEEIANTTITTPSGESLPLSSVAKIGFEKGPNQITRQNRQRMIAITGTARDRAIGDITKEVQTRLANFALPGNYYINFGGAQEQIDESKKSLGVAFILAIILVYMLLASQYESLVHPLAIMFSLPLAVVGVVLALFLTGRHFGVTAFIGIIMLVGIVVKNAILLVDYTNTLRSRGYDRTEAILEAGPTRLRPILMSTSATILGMIPLAVALGTGAESQAPMATAVIGGLATSTLLTLVVVPVVYTILDDLPKIFSRLKKSNNKK
ncbi:MAG: efflux RND transporter permease subunit [Firmicutes bacterium]|nr:efflux RND transporter permease subunit [Bacillota bacterium]